MSVLDYRLGRIVVMALAIALASGDVISAASEDEVIARHSRALLFETRVLSLDTGYRRDYGSGVVYAEYFASQDLMFPTRVNEEQLRQKDYVFGIRDVAAVKAWPLDVFTGGVVISDAVGVREVVLMGDAETRTVRAYDRGGRMFEGAAVRNKLRGHGGLWEVEEEMLVGPDGTRLARVPGHVAYWFAWDGYMGVQSELYGSQD